LLLQRTWLGDSEVDLRVAEGVIESIAAPGSLSARSGERTHRGGLITVPIAEPHVHLDAALLGARMPNRSGTLREGIANWAVLREQLTAPDVIQRALQTAEMYAQHGTSRIRTHVDTASLLAVEAMTEVKAQLAQQGITLQIVAFPQEGVLRNKGQAEQWEAAVALGCDAVGAIPHFERTTEEGWQSVRMAFDLAEKYDCLLDFHCDETDDPGSRNLEVVCAETIRRGLQGRVVAGHCTAMHSYPDPYAAKVIELVAEANVQVITNPLDNVVLQGRYDGYPKRRGITRVDELWAAGATVGIGHDSVMDPWYRLGTANLLDPAYMLLHLGHLTSEAEMARIFHVLSGDNHLPFGGAPPLPAVGKPPHFLWWDQSEPIEILRLRPKPMVVRA